MLMPNTRGQLVNDPAKKAALGKEPVDLLPFLLVVGSLWHLN